MNDLLWQVSSIKKRCPSSILTATHVRITSMKVCQFLLIYRSLVYAFCGTHVAGHVVFVFIRTCNNMKIV